MSVAVECAWASPSKRLLQIRPQGQKYHVIHDVIGVSTSLLQVERPCRGGKTLLQTQDLEDGMVPRLVHRRLVRACAYLTRIRPNHCT